MTVLVQEIMERVLALPEKNQEALLLILTGDDTPIIAESNLTHEELAWIAEGRRDRINDPGGFTRFEDYLAETGRTVGDFRKRRVVYK